MLTVADTVKGLGFPIHTKKRIAGLRMLATDADWSLGNGPSVEGPLASLILVMAGRRAPLEDLSGEGVQSLKARLSPRLVTGSTRGDGLGPYLPESACASTARPSRNSAFRA